MGSLRVKKLEFRVPHSGFGMHTQECFHQWPTQRTTVEPDFFSGVDCDFKNTLVRGMIVKIPC